MKTGIVGTGLITPLGTSPEDVFSAIREGKSALSLHPGFPEPFFASLLPRPADKESFFCRIALQAAESAIREAGIDPGDPSTCLVLSTIKGEIEQIDQKDVSLAATAAHLAAGLGVTSSPIVVSNACISGVAALVQGMRMIRSGRFRQVIVVGAELQPPFVVTGFQSLKALSPEACKPFDASRVGLNLGEAAAAIVLKADEGDWELVAGAIRNDANHISGPSRTGEGSYNALRAVLPFVEKKDLAFVNVHGTATVYNDEMESIALGRAGLTDVPVNALKGYFGHTMGAAGLLESILSMKALEAGIVPATRGFSQLGVSVPVRVSDKEQPAIGNSFIKLLSGFGGVNGAILLRKGGAR